MRILCRECGEKAVITKSVHHTVDARDIYCVCGHCNHRFVWTAGFKHSISGSDKEKIQIMESILSSLSESQKRDLVQRIGL
ncbi:hypothetical protein BZG72_15790 [Salinivibrio sp. PR6]|nr:hypothetical protein BZG19_16080 [Salinivibrio kushneri]OOE78149.1 hypothetical protein BZG72_15790 [Salinivibrio sp. PR6]